MKSKKYKIIRNNKYIYAVKKLGNKGYINSKFKKMKRRWRNEIIWKYKKTW